MRDNAVAKQTFQEKISERRKKMLKFHFRGISAVEWVSLVAQEYGITEIAIWQDWRRRKSWLAKVFNLNDVVDEINMNLVELMNMKEEAWRTYHKAETALGKVAALNVISRAIRDKIEILQSLGAVYKEPQKIEIEGRVAVVELLKVYAPIAARIATGSVSKDDSGK